MYTFIKNELKENHKKSNIIIRSTSKLSILWFRVCRWGLVLCSWLIGSLLRSLVLRGWLRSHIWLRLLVGRLRWLVGRSYVRLRLLVGRLRCLVGGRTIRLRLLVGRLRCLVGRRLSRLAVGSRLCVALVLLMPTKGKEWISEWPVVVTVEVPGPEGVKSIIQDVATSEPGVSATVAVAASVSTTALLGLTLVLGFGHSVLIFPILFNLAAMAATVSTVEAVMVVVVALDSEQVVAVVLVQRRVWRSVLVGLDQVIVTSSAAMTIRVVIWVVISGPIVVVWIVKREVIVVKVVVTVMMIVVIIVSSASLVDGVSLGISLSLSLVCRL